MQYLYYISNKKLEIKLIFCMLINMKADIIVFDGSGQTYPKYPE